MLNVARDMIADANELDPAAHRRRAVEEHSFATHDGTELFYRKWPAASGEPRGAVLLLHRGHEHGGRMAHIPEELGLDDFAFYAWDARGHGRSPGARGHSPSFAASVRDIDCFARHVMATDRVAMEDIAVVAQSVGAVLAAGWVHDYAPPIRALVLASPAFEVKLYVPFARSGIALWQAIRGPFFVNSYVKARHLTNDAGRIASFEADPLIARPIASNMLLDLHAHARRIVADAQAITAPTQLLISGQDFVVRQAPQHDFFINLGSACKERHVLSGFRHDTLGEKDRAEAMGLMRAFLVARFAVAPDRIDLTRADERSHTRDESERLATPLSAMSPKGLTWALNRLSIRIGARFSNGLKTGTETGFDSGSTLDYVYRNEAAGFGPLGRMIDRIFLNAIGWRGIRRRKENLEAAIATALERLAAAGRPIHLLDIAAGHGRYVLDAVAKSAIWPDGIRLRDYSPLNVEAGRAAIRARGMEDRASFELGDAFDAQALASADPRPTLAIVSGLYELFPENIPVSRSLGGLAQAMPARGLLVYTNQPWHPQLELIARCLSSHRGGRAWVMRRRTQGEMDQLVEAAGFRKLGQTIDEWGIFTVSIAERV